MWSNPQFPVFGPERSPYLDTFHAALWKLKKSVKMTPREKNPYKTIDF